MGLTTIGANQVGFTGYLEASRCELSSSARIVSLHLHLAQASGQARAALYGDANGNPGALLAESATQAAVIGWNALDIPDLDITAGTYWLAFQLESGSSASYNVGPDGTEAYVTHPWSAFPASFPICLKQRSQWSLYASACPFSGRPTLTYTPTPTRTPSPTRTPTFTITPTWSPEPVRCSNPTSFGNSAIGNVNIPLPGEMIVASRYHLAKDCFGVSMSVNLSYGDGRIQAALYADDNGNPGTLLLSSEVAFSHNGWNTLNIPDTLLYAGDYWLALQSGGNSEISSSPATMTSIGQAWSSLGTFPAELGSAEPLPDELQARQGNIRVDLCPLEPGSYATATETLSPTPTLTPTITFTFTPTPTGRCSNPAILGVDVNMLPDMFSPDYYELLQNYSFSDGTVACRYHLSQPGYIHTLRYAYYHTSPGATLRGAIYANAGEQPGDLLVQSVDAEVLPASGDAFQFVDMSLPITLFPAGDYWIAVQLEGVTSLFLNETFLQAAPGLIDTIPPAAGSALTSGFPDPWTGSNSENLVYLIEALYCPVEGTPTDTPTPSSPTPTPTDTPTFECSGSGSFGSERIDMFNPDSGTNVRANRFTLTETALLTSFDLFIGRSSGGEFAGAIYDAEFNLLYKTSSMPVASGFSDIASAPFDGQVLFPGDYWLAFWTNNVQTNYNESGIIEGVRVGEEGSFPSMLEGEGFSREYGVSVSYCRVYLSPTPTFSPTETPTITMTPTVTLTPTVTMTPYCEYTPLADLTGYLGGTPVPGDTTGAVNDFCQGGYGFYSPDDLYTFMLTEPHTITASLCGSSYDTTLYLRTACASPDSTLAFDDDSSECASNPSGSKFRVFLGAGLYQLIVDGYTNTADAGSYTLRLRDDRPWPDADNDGFTEDVDCDDTNGSIHPGAPDICGDGIDNDCNGFVDDAIVPIYLDADGDGYGGYEESGEWNCSEGSVPEGYTASSDDCDDENPDIHPEAVEVCDGNDNNCDGVTDEGFEQIVQYNDNDGDGYGEPGSETTYCQLYEGYVTQGGDCYDDDAAVYPGAPELCDHMDNDCDGLTDEDGTNWFLDSDGDGWGNPSSVQASCGQPSGYVANNLDCNDGCWECHPEAEEVCDGLDNDCDGDIDEGLGPIWYYDGDWDGYGDAAKPLQACFQPFQYVASDLDCNDGDYFVNPNVMEVCNNIDDNCNGYTDEGVLTVWYRDADGDNYGNANDLTEACGQPACYVLNDTDCDDSNPAVHPEMPELCNGYDDNCDGTTDTDAVDKPTWYFDGDGDGYGSTAVNAPRYACETLPGHVLNNDDFNDNCALCYPGAPEVCDGVDNNNDGSMEQVGYYDGDGDGYGSTAVNPPRYVCMGPPYVALDGDCVDNNPDVNPGVAEICGNGIDDNCANGVDEGCP